MTPEKETELFADLKYLIKVVDDIKRTQLDHTRQFAHLGRKLDLLTTEPQ